MQNNPFSLLIKPTSADCNMRCEYCFYLEKANLYPQEKTHRMSENVLDTLISTYLETQQPIYAFGWQGGEPSLMGLEFFEKVTALEKKYGRGKAIENGFQTNGTLIDDKLARLFRENNFLVGISLDGPKEIHDKYRLNTDGKGSHDDVLKGIECLKENDVDFNILTLVNSANVYKGKEVYKYLCDMDIKFHQYIPCVEFDNNGNLLPFSITGEQWGDFLCEIFDEWMINDTRRVSIRLFDGIIEQMIYGNCGVCTMSENCTEYFVVEYNGDIYPCDFFVSKETKIGNITRDSWIKLQNSKVYNKFGSQKGDWNEKCNKCEYLDFCSGDCLKHRFAEVNNPQAISWLCDGWKKFYKHSLPEFKKLANSLME